MTSFFQAFDQLLAFLRPAFFWLAVVAGVLCALDWAVRTRRINPFGALGQFLRKFVDPVIAPVERKIVRAGGMPSAAPWWTLVAIVVAGFVVLTVLGFVRTQLGMLTTADNGLHALLAALIQWTFTILQLAILLRVISSWIGLSLYSKWMRWTITLSEPILRPLRQVVPLIGMIDITPLLAYFLLSFTQRILLSLLFGS